MKNMSRTARYMMMYNGRDKSHDREETSRPWEGEVRNSYNTFEVDNRFRDRRGREHYDNGRFAPMKNEHEDDMEMRYRGDDSWRFRNEGGGYITDYAGEYAWPTNNESHESHNKDSWGNEGRVIGFAAAMNGRSSASPFTREMAEEWMANIRNEDGTKGAHWTLEEIKRVMAQKGIECDPVKLWAAVNAEYSDRQAVNKKYGVDKLDFYVDSAIAYWLQDKDAVKDKLSAYYTHVAKH